MFADKKEDWQRILQRGEKCGGIGRDARALNAALALEAAEAFQRAGIHICSLEGVERSRCPGNFKKSGLIWLAPDQHHDELWQSYVTRSNAAAIEYLRDRRSEDSFWTFVF